MKKKKLELLVCTLAMALCVSFANAATYWNGSTDDLWSNAANWSGGVPTKWGSAWIDAPSAPYQPLIDSTVNALSFELIVGKTGGPCTLTMTGGTLYTHRPFVVGGDIEGGTGIGTGIMNLEGGDVTNDKGLMLARHNGSTGTVNMSGGTLEVVGNGTEPHHSHLVIGGRGAGTFNMDGGVLTAARDMWLAIEATSSGNLNMTGGVINVTDTIHIDYQGYADRFTAVAAAPGAIQLDGGVINAGDLVINSLGSMDLTEGRMILDGDDTEVVWGYVDAGLITGYGVANNVLVGYDSRNDKTIVVAIPEPATMVLLGLGSLALLKRRRA